jgi:hypothetical protein
MAECGTIEFCEVIGNEAVGDEERVGGVGALAATFV